MKAFLFFVSFFIDVAFLGTSKAEEEVKKDLVLPFFTPQQKTQSEGELASSYQSCGSGSDPFGRIRIRIMTWENGSGLDLDKYTGRN